METADAFVMISEKETFGMVYVEAMSRRGHSHWFAGRRDRRRDPRWTKTVFCSPRAIKTRWRALFERLHAMPAEEVQALSQNAWESVEALRADKLAESVLASLRVRETPPQPCFLYAGLSPRPGMPSHQVFVARLARAMADCGADVRVIYPVARHRRRREKGAVPVYRTDGAGQPGGSVLSLACESALVPAHSVAL